MKNFKNLLTTKSIIIALAVVLIFSGLVVKSRNNESDDLATTVVDNDESEVEIEEEIKDGVYTNYTYGFSFEYDNKYFDRSVDQDSRKLLYSSQNEFDRISISVADDIHNQGYWSDIYQKCKNAQANQNFLSTRSGDHVKLLFDDKKCLYKTNPNDLVEEINYSYNILYDLEIDSQFIDVSYTTVYEDNMIIFNESVYSSFETFSSEN